MDNFFLDTMMSGRKNGGIFISLAFALFIVCSCTGTDNTVVTVEEDPEVGEASNTGCIDRTRAAASDKQTIVLRKEGDVISCELDNCVGNCSTSYFDVKIDYSKGVGAPDSFFVDVEPVVLNPSDCTCPFNVYFTIRNVKSERIFLYCNWFSGVVSFRDTSIVALDPVEKIATIDGMKYKLMKPGNIARLSFVENSAGEVRVPSTVNYDSEEYTVRSVEYIAFRKADHMTKVILPNTILSIIGTTTTNIFYDDCNSLEEIEVEPGSRLLRSIDGVLFSADHKTLYSYPSGCKRTSYTVPEGVEKIGADAFIRCNNLTSIKFPESVTNFGKRTFLLSENLETIEIRGKLERLSSNDIIFYNMKCTPTVFVPKSEVEYMKTLYKGPVLPLE